MGRSSYSNKTEADDLEKVDTKRLKQEARFLNGQTGGSVQLKYYDGWQKRQIDQRVQLTITNCNYGGVRYWFICPLECKKRIGVLYLHNNEFGCRQCHNLTYRSKNMGRNSIVRLAAISYKLFLFRQPRRLRYAGKMTKYFQRWEKYLEKVEPYLKLMNKN